MAKPTVTIVGTGSTGNFAEVNGDILIDLGVQRSRVLAFDNGSITGPDMLRHVSAALITHEHTDHANPSTVKLLYELRPDLFKRQLFMTDGTYRQLCGANSGLHSIMRHEFPTDHIITDGATLDLRTRGGIYHVETFSVPHGSVECLGFVITTPGGESIFWATDAEIVPKFEGHTFDVICCEGNWDEFELEEALKHPDTVGHAQSSLRHMSVQDFDRFVRQHATPTTSVIQLHMSSAFGTYSHLNNVYTSPNY